MNKKLLLLMFTLLITACSSTPEIVDNGNPGQIKVVVFVDENRKGTKGQDELGVSDKVGISQDISCPAGSMDKVTVAETDLNGETVYEDLQPGVYCIAYLGGKGVTTKLTVEVHLSSDQEALVGFGLTE